MTDEDEYRFYPEDFDESGELIEERDEFDPAAIVIVGSLGVGLGLFLLNPFVDPIPVAGTELEPRILSALVFAVGLFTGSVVYARSGKRSLATVHALGALGWVLLSLGSIRGNDALLAAGGGALVAGAAVLIALVWRSAS